MVSTGINAYKSVNYIQPAPVLIGASQLTVSFPNTQKAPAGRSPLFFALFGQELRGPIYSFNEQSQAPAAESARLPTGRAVACAAQVAAERGQGQADWSHRGQRAAPLVAQQLQRGGRQASRLSGQARVEPAFFA